MRLFKLAVKLSLFSSLLCLFSCDTSYEDTKGRSYDEYVQYQLDSTDFMNQFFSMEDDLYGIYMYGTTCPYCESIKGAVFDYLDNNESNEMKLYIFDRGSNDSYATYFKTTPSGYTTDELAEEMIGATSIDELYYIGVPSLYVIEDGALVEYYIGSTTIGDYLTSL